MRDERTLFYGAAALLIMAALLALVAVTSAQEKAHAEKAPAKGDPTFFPPGHALGGKVGDEAVKAIVLTRFGGGQCSGTIIKPRLKDGSYHILTAWHCDPGGKTVRVRLWDQRVIDAVSVHADQRADYRWLRTVSKTLTGLPMATLATKVPKNGTKVWHRSFGVDRPGNLEEGTVTRAPNQNGQIEYLISVSPGDSGGAAFGKLTDEVYGPWCCTTRLGGVGRVWTASCVIAGQGRPGFASREGAMEVARTWSDDPPPSMPTFAPLLVFGHEPH